MDVLSIQYLRAIAAMMVVIHHLDVQLIRLGYDGNWPGWLPAGVDIFFVISGTIMWLTTEGRPSSPLRFFWRRILRIVPLYWLLTSLMVAIMFAAPGVMLSAHADSAHIAASYLFLPWPHPVTGLAEPVLIPGWTLNYEMAFYLLFGLTLVLPGAWRLVAATTVLAALVALRTLTPAPAPAPALAFYGAGIMLEFAFGLMIGRAFSRGLVLPAWAGTACVVAGFAALAIDLPADSLPRLLRWGVPAALIVGGALSVERRRGMVRLPWLHLLGDASYSLYLSHTILLAVLGRVAAATLPAGHLSTWGLFAAVALPTVTVGAILLYRLVEQPLMRLSRRRAAPAPSSPGA